MRLLYVEDNPVDADLVRRALARDDRTLEVDVATTLQQAREQLAARGDYDLLLADINLPDGQGTELIIEVRARALPMAIVALTSQGDEAVVLAALRAGADDYLAKSDELPLRLPATLRSALQRFRADAARHARVLRVLYAEHDSADLDLTRRHFERHAPYLLLNGVHAATGVMACLPLGPDEPSAVDVLVLDYRLVGENGLEVLKQVRDDRGLDLPVVMVTGQGSEEVAAQAMRLGATDYVVKRGNYLLTLPMVIENAFYRVRAAREQAAVRALNASLERRVEQRTRELQQANHELESFASSVSHDLRAPLRAIDALSALLDQGEQSRLSEDGRARLRMLRASTAKMDRLIGDLLEFARSTRQTPKRVAVEMGPLVRHCVEEFRAEIDRRGVVVDIGELPDCQADPALLRQVLVNLIGNAVKYTRKQPQAQIEMRSFRRDGVDVFSVRDNGAGFDMKHVGKLFQLFQRLHGDAEFDGSGVGLAIVDRIVQRHGGRVWAEAAPGQGATLYFTVETPAESA